MRTWLLPLSTGLMLAGCATAFDRSDRDAEPDADEARDRNGIAHDTGMPDDAGTSPDDRPPTDHDDTGSADDATGSADDAEDDVPDDGDTPQHGDTAHDDTGADDPPDDGTSGSDDGTGDPGTADDGADENTPTDDQPPLPVLPPPAPPNPPLCAIAPDPEALAACAEGDPAVVDGQPWSSIQEAMDAANESPVKICPGSWEADLTAHADVVLEAADPAQVTLLHGAGVHRILTGSGPSITVRGLALSGGYHPDAGGAIDSEGPVTLHCTFMHDNHAGSQGGAIRLYGSGLTVTDSIFAGNSASDDGGAIMMYDGGALHVERSMFLNNESGYSGGAIIATGRESGLTTLIDVSFVGNTSGYEGGAITIDGWEVQTLQLERARFLDNEADYGGGAIASSGWASNILSIVDATFSGNSAGYEGGAASIGGWSDQTAYMERVHFTDNDASYGGGALAIGSWAHDQVQLVDVMLQDNSAGNGGGAIQAQSWDETTLELQNVLAIGNSAPEGGAIDIDPHLSAWISVQDSSFIENTGDGAAIMVGSWGSGGRVQLVGSTFLRNAAPNGSAAIVAEPGRELTCVACDLGSGIHDNTPHDARAAGQVLNGGAGMSFSVP